MEGRNLLVVAHRLSTVRALDRLLVMDHGRVIEEGNHETLIRRPGGVYRRLFERSGVGADQGMSLEELRGDASRFVDEPGTATWRWIRAEAVAPAASGGRRQTPPAAGAYRGPLSSRPLGQRQAQAEADQRGAKDQALDLLRLRAGRQPAPHRAARQRAQHIERQPQADQDHAQHGELPTGPLAGDTNCGSSTEQNSKALGLSTLVSTPDISAPRQLVVFAASAAPPRRTWDRRAAASPQPHQIAATRQPGRVEGPGMRANSGGPSAARECAARARASASQRGATAAVSSGTSPGDDCAPRNNAISAMTALLRSCCAGRHSRKIGLACACGVHANETIIIGMNGYQNRFLHCQTHPQASTGRLRPPRRPAEAKAVSAAEAEIGLSPSPCLRVRMLEDAGVIQGYGGGCDGSAGRGQRARNAFSGGRRAAGRIVRAPGVGG